MNKIIVTLTEAELDALMKANATWYFYTSQNMKKTEAELTYEYSEYYPKDMAAIEKKIAKENFEEATATLEACKMLSRKLCESKTIYAATE